MRCERCGAPLGNRIIKINGVMYCENCIRELGFEKFLNDPATEMFGGFGIPIDDLAPMMHLRDLDFGNNNLTCPRCMFPGNGYGCVNDQFMMGDFLLVAPVVEKGATSRTVQIPPAEWTADDGTVYEGPCLATVDAPLSRLPYFIRSCASHATGQSGTTKSDLR